MSEPCMSVARLAKQFGISRTTVWNAIQRGEVPALRLGNLYRVRPSTIPQEVRERWTNPPQKRWLGLPSGGLVYFLVGVPGYVKIGFTAKLAERMKDLQVASPVPLALVAHVTGCTGLEREYHDRFAEHRCEGEWFRLAPEIEEEIDRIRSVQ